jgi:hypothetical protein
MWSARNLITHQRQRLNQDQLDTTPTARSPIQLRTSPCCHHNQLYGRKYGKTMRTVICIDVDGDVTPSLSEPDEKRKLRGANIISPLTLARLV